MAIKVKANERNISFDKSKEKWAFVLAPELYSRLGDKKVINEAALRSGLAKGTITAAWEAIGEVISAWATEGHSVAIPGLGTMRFGIRGASVEKVDDVSHKMITSRRVIFTPNSELKQELKDTAIQITCYDRTGKEIKRITTDAGDVEDGDDSNPSGGGTDPGTGGGDEGME